MRKLSVLLFLVLFMASALGQVQYQIDSDRENVLMNVSIQLECNTDCPVNRWQIDWQIPENAEVLWINDSIGRIDDYEVFGNQIRLTTNKGPKRNSETLKIALEIDEPAKQVYRDLHRRTVSLPGFRGDRMTGFTKSESLVSGWIGFDFESSFSDNEMRFSGTGPTNIRLNFGEGEETKYFKFFGDYSGDTEKAYEISVGTTGLVQNFKRFPVASMPSDVYDRKVNQWSSGEYQQGSIVIRQSLEEDYAPILAHETVHGLNDRALKWDDTSSSYFDEGVAEHVEYIVKRSEGQRTANLFGEDTSYTEKRDGKRYRITISSKGDREELWNYYQDGKDFMKRWSPHKDPEVRRFGYSYSELIIKNYIVHQNGSIKDIYSEMDFNQQISDPEQKWSFYSQHMDVTPCKYSNRERFNQCIDEINDYSYSVYRGEPTHSGGHLQIEKVELPEVNRTSNPVDKVTGKVSKLELGKFVKGFLAYLGSLLNGLLN